MNTFMTTILQVREVTKQYGNLTAVDRASFEIREGEIHAEGEGRSVERSLRPGDK